MDTCPSHKLLLPEMSIADYFLVRNSPISAGRIDLSPLRRERQKQK